MRHQLSVSSMKGPLPVCIKQLGQFAGSPAWFLNSGNTLGIFFTAAKSIALTLSVQLLHGIKTNRVYHTNIMVGFKMCSALNLLWSDTRWRRQQMASDGSHSAPGQLPDHKTLPIFSEHSSGDSYCSDKSSYTIMCPNYIMVLRSSIWQ